MKYVLKVYSIFEPGQRVDDAGNAQQEDCLFPAYKKQKDTDRLFLLCDGMGGHEKGEVASSTVCEAMSRSVFESAPDPEGPFTDDDLKKAVTDALDALDAADEGREMGGKKMGTTMTLLKFHDAGCTVAHIGDSRVYHIRPGKDREDTQILFQTIDHSLVNDLVKAQVITPEEAKTSKQKNVITRAMLPNLERRPRADIHHITDVRKNDYFYLCSDGMLEQMEDDNIRFIFSESNGDDEKKVNVLTKSTSQNHDNHSAFIIHVMDVIDPLPVEEPEPEKKDVPQQTTEPAESQAEEPAAPAPKPKAREPEPIMAVVEEEDDDDTLPPPEEEEQNNSEPLLEDADSEIQLPPLPKEEKEIEVMMPKWKQWLGVLILMVFAVFLFWVLFVR